MYLLYVRRSTSSFALQICAKLELQAESDKFTTREISTSIRKNASADLVVSWFIGGRISAAVCLFLGSLGQF